MTARDGDAVVQALLRQVARHPGRTIEAITDAVLPDLRFAGPNLHLKEAVLKPFLTNAVANGWLRMMTTRVDLDGLVTVVTTEVQLTAKGRRQLHHNRAGKKGTDKN